MNLTWQLLRTEKDWKDLVVNSNTFTLIRDLESTIKNKDILQKELVPRKSKGYLALFYGPEGTGKTMTATLLGKSTGKDVYRIDLSAIVSKFIGETEKNLSKLFAEAENKDWILFFDEADALFGKRTNIKDAHDKYANQEVAYLLQLIEQNDVIVILAATLKGNIDEAFSRRLNSIIYFPKPNENERIRLWRNAFPKSITLDNNIDLEAMAKKHELTGSEIINITQYACGCAQERPNKQLYYEDIFEGIKKAKTKKSM